MTQLNLTSEFFNGQPESYEWFDYPIKHRTNIHKRRVTRRLCNF